MASPAEEKLTDYSPDGVDLTLIRWFLSMSPLERLAYVSASAADISRIREVASAT
jgi:hypothetical protein